MYQASPWYYADDIQFLWIAIAGKLQDLPQLISKGSPSFEQVYAGSRRGGIKDRIFEIDALM